MNKQPTFTHTQGNIDTAWSVQVGVADLSPNPISVAVSIARVLVSTGRPRPAKGSTVAIDHSALRGPLETLRREGTRILPRIADPIDSYLTSMADVRPDALGHDEALAFWMNVYNAGALRLAGTAVVDDVPSVLRIPGGFSRPSIRVASESLSLDAIEHGKIRRFRDPRIHAALVCGSVSCPTLRPEPYRGDGLDRQLDLQMRTFLESGAATATDGAVTLSRIFLWFGADFVRPHRMPTLLPARKAEIVEALAPWLPAEVSDAIAKHRQDVRFAPYDWGLRCAVA